MPSSSKYSVSIPLKFCPSDCPECKIPGGHTKKFFREFWAGMDEDIKKEISNAERAS